MAEVTTTKGKGPTPEKFRAHGVQNDWLNKAKGKSVEVRLTDGQTRSGRLAEHDIYCLALEEAGQDESTLIYKHAIVCVTLSEK
jgi:RNA chaperone Hfq